MAIINLLDKNVYNRISAGEVVERPASMVKELVENSLDAGADKIEIKIENGGITCVEVSDNGCGIEKSQLSRAFLPHATSKIKTAADLDAIYTLGFRGEALASIGAVTQAEILSKTQNEQTGYALTCTGGELSEVFDKQCETGTTVTCRNLFFNTPARAKFLKTPRAEEGEIVTTVTRLAFSNPNASFKLTADGKVVLETYGGGIKECLAAVYGAKTPEQCFYIESRKNGIALSGFIGKLTFTKPTRAYQTLIVNGRFVTDTTVSAAVQNAYSSYLMKRQYPFFVLSLTVPPEIVDVNVHPRKSEVRFSNNQIVYSAVYSAVSKVIDGVSEAVNIIKGDSAYSSELSAANSGSNGVNGGSSCGLGFGDLQKRADFCGDDNADKNKTVADLFGEFNKKSQSVVAENGDFSGSPVISESPRFTGEPNASSFENLRVKVGGESGAFATVRDSGAGSAELLERVVQSGYVGSFEPEDGVDVFAENKKYIERLERENAQKATALQGEMTITDNDVFVGQAFDTYLIFTRGDDMYFIDQHAAHERLLFDELCEKVNAHSVEKQALLIPYSFYVSPDDFENIYERMDYFREIGIDIDLIGENGFCVSALPLELSEINLRKFFDDILYDNAFKREKMPLAFKEKLMQTACKHAVKGGDKLDKTEIDELLKKVSQNLGLKCPHGRPIAVKITKTELEKWFKRIV